MAEIWTAKSRGLVPLLISPGTKVLSPGCRTCEMLRPEILNIIVFAFFSDKTLIMWKLTRDETNYGVPQRALRGHGHFVSDVVMSSDGQFALSGSWDGTLRLWDLST